jgi:hypothetical protein
MAAPSGAREDAMRFLLQTGADAGVKMIATKPGGDGERLLGQAWPFPSPFRVTVQTVALSEGLDRVEARARRSLERMGLPRGEALLVNNAADLAGAEGRALWDRLQSLKTRGLFRSIGFCATVEDGPALLARRLEADVVQISCNLLDQRAAAEGVLDEIKAGVWPNGAAISAAPRCTWPRSSPAGFCSRSAMNCRPIWPTTPRPCRGRAGVWPNGAAIRCRRPWPMRFR